MASLLSVKRECFQDSTRAFKWKGSLLSLVCCLSLHFPQTENQVTVHNLILALNNVEHTCHHKIQTFLTH